MISPNKNTRLIHGLARTASTEVVYTIEFPHADDTIDPVPGLFVNGFCGIKAGYRGPRHETALSGKPAITLEQNRQLTLRSAADKDTFIKPARLLCKAVGVVMKDVRDTYGYEQVDLIGHSMGGYISANVAEHRPERVRSVTFLASAGMEPHSLWVIARRFPAVAKDMLSALPQLPEELRPMIRNELEHVLANPTRTLSEGISVANCDIRPQIRKLGKIGIITAALQFAADGFFPLDKVRQHSENIVDRFEVHPNEKLGHLGPQIDPKGTVDIWLGMLDDMLKHRTLTQPQSKAL